MPDDWGNLLLAGLLFPIIGGVLGSWLWAKYDATDFAARRSVASTQKKIEKLEQRLRIFEYIVEDTNRYLARIILDGVIVILLFLSYVVCMFSMLFYEMFETLNRGTNNGSMYINDLRG
jgi:hypothetical protein